MNEHLEKTDFPILKDDFEAQFTWSSPPISFSEAEIDPDFSAEHGIDALEKGFAFPANKGNGIEWFSEPDVRHLKGARG